MKTNLSALLITSIVLGAPVSAYSGTSETPIQVDSTTTTSNVPDQAVDSENIKAALLRDIAAELKNGNYGIAISKIDELESLQIKIPSSVKYFKGISYLKIEDKEHARLAFKTYLLTSSEKARYYSNALALLESIDTNQYVPISKYSANAPTGNRAESDARTRTVSRNTSNNPIQTASAYQQQNIQEEKQATSIGKVSMINSDFGYGSASFDNSVDCTNDKFYILKSGNKHTLSVGKQVSENECTVFPKGAAAFNVGLKVYKYTDRQLAHINAEEAKQQTIARAAQRQQRARTTRQASNNGAKDMSNSLKATAGILGFASSLVGGDAIINNVVNTMNTTAGAIDAVESLQQPSSGSNGRSQTDSFLNGLNATKGMLNAIESGDVNGLINSEVNMFKSFSDAAQ